MQDVLEKEGFLSSVMVILIFSLIQKSYKIVFLPILYIPINYELIHMHVYWSCRTFEVFTGLSDPPQFSNGR